MFKFILLTFAFLAVLFYQMSGGSSFDPEAARQAAMEVRADREGVELPASEVSSSVVAKADAATTQSETDPTRDVGIEPRDNEVSRVALNLTSVRDVIDEDNTPKPPILPADELSPSNAPEAPDDADVTAALEEALVDAPTSQEATEVVLPSLIFEGESYAANSAAAAPGADIRQVTGTLVNVRGGPGTDFEVVGQLSEGAPVEIIRDNGAGWVQMRPVDGGETGWMADFLLSDG
ncbi:SH3 domain-containing protein [Sulfitobacter sp. D35]|uniref:SH3 domain-containing protein n=1 Tax=Sulfitobacter sp. D35 TaxID=3083252 RepID=UPI00296FDB67|nr:SH3 domain-containing protein [Sulfitobacter sp. D35]MDW4500544.1 SH3 domain-containing protein [Sulfitobacter sp. D35]